MTTAYRLLPSVERLLSDESIALLIEEHSRPIVIELVRQELDEARSGIKSGGAAPRQEEIIAAVSARAEALTLDWPQHVINATGVVLHTNLGRSPLSADAIRAMQRAAQGYSDLELDLLTGRRGSRQAHISGLVARATGAEAALVVNNNASAMMLGLAAIATGKEVIVSRGEAVEIGGGFRIPDVLAQSGATLVEVGTTNRTYARDYEAAITENTGALLAVHASNFRVMGFTHAPEIRELVEIGARRGVPVLHDLGSGCLLDSAQFGLMHEPMPQESVKAGVGLSFFSGDKLLGGPQAGIIAGKKALSRCSGAPSTGKGYAYRQAEHGCAGGDAGALHSRRGAGQDTDMADDCDDRRRCEGARQAMGGRDLRSCIARAVAIHDRRRQPAGRDAAHLGAGY